MRDAVGEGEGEEVVKLKFTDRGFARADFKDANGEECSIQESSVATDYMLWLGCNEGLHHMGACLARMHLTRDMARDLIRLLRRFVDTGRLSGRRRDGGGSEGGGGKVKIPPDAGRRTGMKTVSVGDVLAWNPCRRYTKEVVEKLFAGREKLSALEILDLDILVEDRFWALLRNDFLSDRDLRLFAADCAEQVLPIFEHEYPEDKRPRNAIKVLRQYARGEIDAAAWAAADAAARAAAGDWQVAKLREYLIASEAGEK
jgi:hypothetical protein